MARKPLQTRSRHHLAGPPSDQRGTDRSSDATRTVAVAPKTPTMTAMCGIAGIVRFDEQPIERKQLWEFCDALGHRGPDDRGIWLGQMGRCPVGLAHTRLAVIDPSPAGHQPMAGPDQRCQVTYNGEIYNFRQIRQELEAQGAHFRSHSDTEVLLTAYQTWGTECFRRLAGMWA